MGAPAWAAAAVEGGVIADQEAQLRRGFGIEVRAHGEAALAVRLRLSRLRVDGFPDLYVFEEMRGHRPAGILRMRAGKAADMGRGFGAAVEFDQPRVPQILDALAGGGDAHAGFAGDEQRAHRGFTRVGAERL